MCTKFRQQIRPIRYAMPMAGIRGSVLNPTEELIREEILMTASERAFERAQSQCLNLCKNFGAGDGDRTGMSSLGIF